MMYEQFADVYDRLMDDFDYPAWAEYYLALLGERGMRPRVMCECGCGTGSMSVEFARRGIKLVASDISGDMLRSAAEKARKNGLSIVFVQQDMRDFQLHRRVDAVVCCCDGVNYLAQPDDVRAFFCAAWRVLRPGGCLAFDISSRHKLRDLMGNAFFGEERDDVAYLWQNSYCEETQQIYMDITFFVRQKNDLYLRFAEQHLQRAHSTEEVLLWLAECGFEQCAAYGDRVLRAPAPDEQRIHFVAVKPLEERSQ